MSSFQQHRAATAAARYCGQCGHPAKPGGRFCGACGAPLAVAGHAASTPADVSNPAPAAGIATSAAMLGDLIAGLQTLPVKTLVPLRAWWSDGVWRQGWTGLFLLAALTPFFLIHLADSAHSFSSVSWGFSLYFAFIWYLALHTLIKPDDVAWPVLARVALFTVIAGVSIAVGLEKHLAAGQMSLPKFIFGVGVPEELAKALPVYLFVFRSARRYDLRSYLFIGAVSGLAFGAAEAVSYSQLYAQAAVFGDASTTIVTAVWRLVTDSIFHACMAGITGFFVGLGRLYRHKAGALIVFGLVFAAVLHGLYDNYASGWTGALFATAIVFAFVGYIHTGEQIGVDLAGHDAPAATSPPPQ